MKALYQIVILIGALCFMSSCEQKVLNEDVVIIIDKSKSQDGLDDQETGFIRNLINIDLLVESGSSLNMHFVECGSSPIPTSESILLDGANMLITPVYEREEDVANFNELATSKFNRLLTNGYQDELSQTYRSFVYAASLIRKDADTKRIYFRSDFLECSPVLNMEKLGTLEYEKVKSAFYSDEPMPDFIDGLEVILICESDSEKSLQAVRIWSRLLQEAGASVQVKSILI